MLNGLRFAPGLPAILREGVPANPAFAIRPGLEPAVQGAVRGDKKHRIPVRQLVNLEHLARSLPSFAVPSDHPNRGVRIAFAGAGEKGHQQPTIGQFGNGAGVACGEGRSAGKEQGHRVFSFVEIMRLLEEI